MREYARTYAIFCTKRQPAQAGASFVLVTLDTFNFSQFGNIVVKGELVFGTGVADSVNQRAEGNDMQGANVRTASVKQSAGRLTRLGLEVAANIAAVLILFQVYKLVRKTFIQRGETLGYDHAYSVVDFEKRLHLFFELDLQRWVIDSTSWIKGFNYFYSYNMWIFLTCLSLMIVFAHEKYKFWRRVFFFSMLVALPWYALYPLAPPRFMSDIGFVDTLAVYGPSYFKQNSLIASNQFAAMPSMHCGWTLIGACMLTATLKQYIGRFAYIFGGLLAGSMFLTVIVTGNHWWIDGVAGGMVVGASVLLAQRAPVWWAAFRTRLAPAAVEQPASSRQQVVVRR